MNVLVIDDHYLIRRGFQGLLASLSPPCETLLASSLEEAEAMAMAQATCQIDIAFLDLGIPGCTGLEAMARFRDSFREVPVVVVSGTVTPETVQGALELGARGFIPKATALDETVFESAVRQILEEGLVYLPAEAQAAQCGTSAEELDACKAFGLAAREEEVFEMLMNGFPNKSIADAMNITVKGVKAHVTSLFRKAEVRTRTELIVKAHRLGVRVPVRRRKTLGDLR